MPKRTLQGVVVSDKQTKTVVVRVDRRFTHPIYKKTIRRSKNYHAHDENSEFKFPENANFDELDTAKAGSLATLLSNPTFSDVLPKDKATPEFMKNAISAKLDTFEDFHYEVKLLEIKEGNKEAFDK